MAGLASEYLAEHSETQESSYFPHFVPHDATYECICASVDATYLLAMQASLVRGARGELLAKSF